MSALRMMIINVTRTTLDTERNIIAHMNDGKGQAEPIRADFDATNANLTPTRIKRLRRCSLALIRLLAYEGYAGTGVNPAHALLLFDDIFFGISILSFIVARMIAR